MRSWSLATRLTVWHGTTTFVMIAATMSLLYWVLVRNLDREDDDFLLDKVHILKALLQERPGDDRLLREEVEWEPSVRQNGQVYVRLLDSAGSVWLETASMSPRLPVELFPSVRSSKQEPGQGEEIDLPDGASFRLVAAGAPLPGADGRFAIIQIALDRTQEEHLLASYRRYLWGGLLVSLLVACLAGYQIARRGLQPLADFQAATERIRSSTLDERLAVDHLPTELAAFATTFNHMMDRLQDSFDRLARFSADIAHELRNPVNNLRGEVEVALGKVRSPSEYQEVLGSCLEECGRLTRMIDSLLLVARAESPQTQITRECVDLRAELQGMQEFYEAAASEAGVALEVEPGKPIHSKVDRALLQRALGNLVANALAHTPAGGAVRLSISRLDGQVCIEVADTGAGIPAEHLPHVFDRFYRVDRARTNSSMHVGLGLAIVKAIASLHEGTVTAVSEPGRGTRIRLFLPEQGKQPATASGVQAEHSG